MVEEQTRYVRQEWKTEVEGYNKTIGCQRSEGEMGRVRTIRHGRNKVASNDGAGLSSMGGGAANGRNGELNGA